MQLRAIRAFGTLYVMAGRERIGAEILCHFEQIGELDALVAQHAGHRGESIRVRICKHFHHAGAEALLVVEHVMGDPEPLRHAPRVGNILARAARAFPLCRRAMVVKLQRDADNFVVFAL